MRTLVRDAATRFAFPLAGIVADLIAFHVRQPIFVVGTGRCGTSLLVRMLGSHPSIARFPGEANDLWHPKLYPTEKSRIETPPIEVFPHKFTELSIESWPPNHSERIIKTFSGFNLIVGRWKTLLVKSAMISFMIPKIVEMFPGAKFIHIYRYGPFVVDSYFKKNFGKYSRYIYSEEEYYRFCARYWNHCIMEIEKSKASLSLVKRNKYFELSYEDLCTTPKDILMSLAEYIGVERNGFTFDLSTIRCAKGRITDPGEKWKAFVYEEMYPAMKLKGYLPQESCT